MPGVYGTSELQKVAVDAANVLNNAFKGGLLGGLGVLSALSQFQSVNFVQVGNEVRELDAADRATVEAAFKGALKLPNQAVQSKIEAALSSIDDAFDLVAEGLEVFNDALALEQKVKALLGL